MSIAEAMAYMPRELSNGGMLKYAEKRIASTAKYQGINAAASGARRSCQNARSMSRGIGRKYVKRYLLIMAAYQRKKSSAHFAEAPESSRRRNK